MGNPRRSDRQHPQPKPAHRHYADVGLPMDGAVPGSIPLRRGSIFGPVYYETSRRIGVRPDSVQVVGETLSHCGCPPVSLVWFSHGLRPRWAPREERLKGICSAQSSGVSLLNSGSWSREVEALSVIIGMDPHKRSATIEVVD